MLVARSLQQVEGGFRWRTDARLRYASALKLAEDNVRAVLGGLELPGLLLMASAGMAPRMRGHEALGWHAGLAVEEIAGCHHCHMLEQAPAIAARIQEFWRNCGQG
jgi:pimeloyl-ACP methyl ester carboxylesterase